MTGLATMFHGVVGLWRVGRATRFRMRGRYWSWRNETAFGAGRPTPRTMLSALLEYGAWTRRMRRLGRASFAPGQHGPRPGSKKRYYPPRPRT
ncbi:MAG: hypothetical protein AAF937_04695 [Planctomycetota bacterium]